MSKKEEIPNSVIDLPVYHGVLQEKKCTPKADSEDSYYHYVIGFIGFTITHEVKAEKFNDFNLIINHKERILKTCSKNKD